MFARFALTLLAALVSSVGASAFGGGSVFMLDRFAQHREGNAFHRLNAVFFSAGPGLSCAGAGLDDGDYFFAVTDPEGSRLLTLDDVRERRVRVTGGVLSAYLGSTRLVGKGAPCGGIYIQLAPVMRNPDPLAEYKLWLTRVADYDPLGGGMFGFDPGRCKSDNFRVIPTPAQTIVRGHKYYDLDRDGAQDATEKPVGGWRVELYENGVLDGVTFTDEDGTYLFIRNRDNATYQVRERSPNGFVNDATPGATWVATTPRAGDVVVANEYAAGPEFGNVVYELAPGVGRTPEFWIDRDGDVDVRDDILCPTDPVWRIALNVRNGLPVNLRKPVSSSNPNASIFTLQVPSGSSGQSCNGAFANWKSFVNKNPHDHAGFLLSRQVGATLLSNSVGFMQGSVLVNRNLDGVLVPLDVMLDGVIALLSETGAGETGPNDPFQDLRHRMQMCTNEFSRINETGDPGAVQVLYSLRPEVGRVPAPYVAVGF